MGNVGFLLQFFSFIAGISAIVFYFLNIKEQKVQYEKYAKYSFVACAVLLTLSSLVLVLALAQSDFSIEYVAQYTDRSLPLIYKISAFWAGQAGSLMFWGWLVALAGIFEIVRLKSRSEIYRSSVLLVVAVTTTFFLILTNFVTNPFKMLDFVVPDGNGMNPLLQNPGMLYHPPTLYLGFVGLTIPFAHGFASLVSNNVGSGWVKDVRGWTIISWVFLTIGIVLGGQWAYVELGWGGYWAWDPVENASLLPWITATGYIHSSIMYERRNKLKLWTYVLAWISFELCIFGTFLTRSGVIDSVHSFGKSSLGGFFVFFIVFTTAVFAYYLWKSKNSIDESSEINLISKEGLFYFSNWVFFGLMFVIFFGTTLPIFTQLFASKYTVGIPYYNMVSTPFFMMILILSGIAPLMPYSESNLKEVAKIIAPSFILALICAIVIYLMGYRKVVPILLLLFTFFSFWTIVIQIFKNIRLNGIKAIFKHRRFYGAMGTHLGLVIIAFAVIMSSFYRYEVEKVVKPGEVIQFGPYTLHVGDFKIEERQNYVSVMTPTRVYQSDKYLVTMLPERRFYNNNQEAFAEVGIYTKASGDLYIILASYSMNDQVIGLQVVWEPFVVWIWIGCAIMVLSALHGVYGRKSEQ
ncbi:MAG: cytochrome c biogenesis protein CcsA [Calditerrivibrio sp.]|nr:cytochrome c biogenesis protein CcsA [Calditerrivibrio sp.]